MKEMKEEDKKVTEEVIESMETVASIRDKESRVYHRIKVVSVYVKC